MYVVSKFAYAYSPSIKDSTMTADLPPNLASTAASAIVRQAEDARTLEKIAKRQQAEQK